MIHTLGEDKKVSKITMPKEITVYLQKAQPMPSDQAVPDLKIEATDLVNTEEMKLGEMRAFYAGQAMKPVLCCFKHKYITLAYGYPAGSKMWLTVKKCERCHRQMREWDDLFAESRPEYIPIDTDMMVNMDRGESYEQRRR